MSKPVLIGCVWGASDPEALPTAALVVEAAAAAIGDVEGLVAVAGGDNATLADVLGGLPDGGAADAIVVPLSLGFAPELSHEIAATIAATGKGRAAGPLAPDVRLVEIVTDRIKAAKVDRESTLVLAVEGSSDPLSRVDAADVAESLRSQWSGPVRIGSVAGAEASVTAAVEQARAYGEEGTVAIASFLLWPGARQSSLGQAGAAAVTEQLAPHPTLVSMVIDRYSAVAKASA